MAEHQEHKQDKPARPQMEMGGSGTAKASFKDALGGDVKIKSSEWFTTGAVVATADDKDPASAKLFAAGPGPATIRVVGQSDDGSAQAVIEVMVIEKGAPVEGKIELSVQPAPAKKAPEAPAKPAAA